MGGRSGFGAVGALLALCAALAGPAGAVAGFGDVDDGRYFTRPVQWLVDEGITTGTSPTCFSPGEPVTRGQAAAFLWRLAGSPTGAPQHPFVDVSAAWQETAVSWLAAEGITTGTSPTTFSPADPLTRGQMAALLHRAAGSPAAPPTSFPDIVAPWQLEPVGWLEAEGITTGTSLTTFSPDLVTTRGQFATLAWRWKGAPAVGVDAAEPVCGVRDDFDGELLLDGWGFVGGSTTGPDFTSTPGALALLTTGTITEQHLLRTPPAADVEIATHLEFRPQADFEHAGLIMLAAVPGTGFSGIQLVRGNCSFGPPACAGDDVYLSSIDGGTTRDFIAAGIDTTIGAVHLRLRSRAGVVTGAYSADGAHWIDVGSISISLPDADVGIFAGSPLGFAPSPAVFHWYAERAL